MNTCRFCKQSDFGVAHPRLVKYGARHYACHACYLDAGKDLAALPDWRIAAFPYRLLKERGLDEIAIAACERLRAKEVA